MKWNFLILALPLVSFAAKAGNEVGNGGDGYSQEFISLGRSMLERMRQNPDPRVANLEALSEAVEKTNVSTKNQLELAGAEVDAINYPETKRIELSRARWKGYNAEEKAALVLHEYLGIANIEDKHYQVSGSYSSAAAEISSHETYESAKRPFSLGVGGGIQSGQGNLGKLYSPTPSYSAHVGFFLAPHFSTRTGLDISKGDFSAAPVGFVNYSLTKVELSLLFHFHADHQISRSKAFDPYVLLGGSSTRRTRTFETLNSIQKDSANGILLGMGTNIFLNNRLAFWFEAKADQIYFEDRFNGEFIDSGIQDTTGFLLSSSVGIQTFF